MACLSLICVLTGNSQGNHAAISSTDIGREAHCQKTHTLFGLDGAWNHRLLAVRPCDERRPHVRLIGQKPPKRITNHRRRRLRWFAWFGPLKALRGRACFTCCRSCSTGVQVPVQVSKKSERANRRLLHLQYRYWYCVNMASLSEESNEFIIL